MIFFFQLSEQGAEVKKFFCYVMQIHCHFSLNCFPVNCSHTYPIKMFDAMLTAAEIFTKYFHNVHAKIYTTQMTPQSKHLVKLITYLILCYNLFHCLLAKSTM